MQNYLHIENAKMVFDTKKGKFTALTDINLTVKQGEFIAYTAWRVRPKQPGEILGTTLAAANDSDERVRALDGMKALCERELEVTRA